MKRFSMIFLGALALMLTVIFPGAAYAAHPTPIQGSADMSLDAVHGQGAVLAAVKTDLQGQTVIAGKGDDDDKHDDKNDDHSGPFDPTKMLEHGNDDAHHGTPEPFKTPGHDDNDHMMPDPTHTPGSDKASEFRGRIEAMNGNAWIIDGQTVMVTDRTRMEAKYGPLAVGTMVEVKAMPQADGTWAATRIEASRQDAASMSDTLPVDDATSLQTHVQQMQTQAQNQVQTSVQLTARQQQALDAINTFIQWLMETFNLDFSQATTLLSPQDQ